MKKLLLPLLTMILTACATSNEFQPIKITDKMIYLFPGYEHLEPNIRDAAEMVAYDARCTDIQTAGLDREKSAYARSPIYFVMCDLPSGDTKNIYVKDNKDGTYELQPYK